MISEPSGGSERVLGANSRRSDVRRSAPQDLLALGVDRPNLRWRAAQCFIREERTVAEADADVLLLRIMILRHARSSWRTRGAPSTGPDDSDLLEAQLAISKMPPKPARRYHKPVTDEELLALARKQCDFENERKAYFDAELRRLGFGGLGV